MATILLLSIFGVLFLYLIDNINIISQGYKETYEEDNLLVYRLLAKQDKLEIEVEKD